MKKTRISNKRTKRNKRNKIINNKKRSNKRSKRRYSRKNKKSIKKRKLKGGGDSLSEFIPASQSRMAAGLTIEEATKMAGGDPAGPKVAEMKMRISAQKKHGDPVSEVPKYQRRKLVQLKENEKLENIYTGGVRIDEDGEDNTFILHLFQFLYNTTKNLVTTFFPSRVPGPPTKEEVNQLALLYLEARAVVELTIYDEKTIEILKYYGLEFNEQNKAFLLIERSKSLLQEKCFDSQDIRNEDGIAQGLWEKRHLKPLGEWTVRGENYCKDIYIVCPVLEIEIKGNNVEIITDALYAIILRFEGLLRENTTICNIFVVELDREVSITLIDNDTGTQFKFSDFDLSKKLKIIFEVEETEGLTEKLSEKITIRSRRKQNNSTEKPWICDFELPIRGFYPAITFQMWRVELAEARLPLELSSDQGGQPGRILYSVIGIGYDPKNMTGEEFKSDYKIFLGNRGRGLGFARSRVMFMEEHIPNELVKIRDMSQNPDSYTLKENGFCYVDMASEFQSNKDYHFYSLMLGHAAYTGNGYMFSQFQEQYIEFINGIAIQLIRKIFGDSIDIDLSLGENIAKLTIDGKSIYFEFIPYFQVTAFHLNYRKGHSKSFPTLHMDLSTGEDIIMKEGLKIDSINTHSKNNTRIINYWVNLTRNKSSPEFTYQEGVPIKEQITDYKTKFDTYTKTSNENPLYSNSLVLCDKKTTSRTQFVQLTGSVTGQVVAKPINYSFINEEGGMLPVTYDGLPYGCGYFFSSQEVLHSALNYTTDSLAIFPNPEKVFKSQLDKMSLDKMSLEEMKKIVISFGVSKRELEGVEISMLREYLNPGGRGHKQFLEWEKSQKISSVVKHWKKYVEKKKKEEAATKIQAFVRGKQSRKKEQDRQIREQGQGGGSLDPYGDVIRESLEIRFIVKITNEAGDPLTNEYLGDPQIGQIFTTI